VGEMENDHSKFNSQQNSIKENKSNKKHFLTIAVDSVMGVPRVAGTGSTLGKGGLSAPIPVLRPGYRVIAGCWSLSTNVFVSVYVSIGKWKYNCVCREPQNGYTD
jgi:hypothetical protein